MSLNTVYQTLTQEDFLHSIMYWLAVPTLLLAQMLGCGKEVNIGQYRVFTFDLYHLNDKFEAVPV
jgi:hypothetical protein